MKQLFANIKYIKQIALPRLDRLAKYMRTFDCKKHLLTNSIHSIINTEKILDTVFHHSTTPYCFYVKKLPDVDELDKSYIEYKERRMPHQKYGEICRIKELYTESSINFIIPQSVNNIQIDTTKLKPIPHELNSIYPYKILLLL